MKKLFALITLALLTSISTFSAFAYGPQDISLGTPGYAGTGCPNGSASVTLAPDKKSLSILFDQYVATAGGTTGKSLDRKTCNLAVPVHVPQGYSISVFKIDYRGYVNVPVGGSGTFNVEYFFAGIRAPQYTKTFSGGHDGEYVLSDGLVGRAFVWSACGQDVNLRVNSSMLVRSNRGFEDAMGTVDSIDIKAGMVYHIQWRECR
ncbi:MAG: DUF4360 domain-containing protein [Oligoflexia bacterium]|nr:DUF4360 domain-containing protein [Oligoflexia bacterium]